MPTRAPRCRRSQRHQCSRSAWGAPRVLWSNRVTIRQRSLPPASPEGCAGRRARAGAVMTSAAFRDTPLRLHASVGAESARGRDMSPHEGRGPTRGLMGLALGGLGAIAVAALLVPLRTRMDHTNLALVLVLVVVLAAILGGRAAAA